MIYIEFIIPYAELKETVRRVAQRHPRRDEFHLRVSAVTADRADSFVPDGDVVIVRGQTAHQLKKRVLSVPIVELPIGAADILRSIQRTIYRFHPGRIAMVGPYEGIYKAIDLPGLFGCDIRCFPQHDLEEIPDAIQDAKDWGCDAVIGGYTVHLNGVAQNIPSLIFEVGDDGITQALHDALDAVCRLRAERQARESAAAIFANAQDGFVTVDRRRMITSINPAAREFCPAERREPAGRLLGSVFPFLQSDFSSMGEGARTEIRCKSDFGTLSVSFLPVGDDGWVVQMRRVGGEGQARKKAGDRGLSAKYHFLDIIHQSDCMAQVIEAAKKYAGVSSNILITGETGTGKELLAQSIHNASSRHGGVFLAVNCATLPESLLESELFGYVDGAFTGTVKGGRAGLFELAHGGTIFLDEISEIPLTFQSKLLRVLQEREIRRIGDDRILPVDVRVIASSNRDLPAMVAEGSFRADLFYRLDTLKIHIPPLRERREDIRVLFLHFLDRYNHSFGGSITGFSPGALDLLSAHGFPGNVRELKNVAERLSVDCKGVRTITEQQMLGVLRPPVREEWQQPPVLLPVSCEPELAEIHRVLRECGNNQSKAARMLGINRSTLWRKLQKSRIQGSASG